MTFSAAVTKTSLHDTEAVIESVLRSYCVEYATCNVLQKELCSNNYPVTLRSKWNKFTVSIMSNSNVCLNVLITLYTIWNELSDNKRGSRRFSQDYLIGNSCLQ